MKKEDKQRKKKLKLNSPGNKEERKVEMRGFEPRTSRMQSARSTTELHPLRWRGGKKINYINYITVGLRDGRSTKTIENQRSHIISHVWRLFTMKLT